MFIDRIPNRRSPPAILLRESFRQDGKSRKRTLANLSRLPKHVVDALDALLKGTTQTPSSDTFDIVRTLPHGHVAAVLGSLRNCGIDRIIAPRRSPQRDLVAGMIAARILEPSSKLVRRFASKTATSTLADELRLPAEEIDENLLYEAMDWLVARQEAIERRLARKHLEEGALVLMTSAWSYSRCCPLVRHGYSRDGKKGVPQIECCAIAPDGRSRSRLSRAILQTRPRWLRRSASCAGVSSYRGSSWSVTAACCSYPRRRQACGARLDQRPARARGPCSGRQRRASTLPFRRARHG